MQARLDAENAYADAVLAGQASTREQLFGEYRTRVQETDQSVPVRHGAWWYFSRTARDAAYPVHCRVPAPAVPDASGSAPPVPGAEPLPGEQVLLDQNVLAEGHEFLSIGTLEISPDHQWLAYGSDATGDERFTLRFRRAGTEIESAEAVAGVSYGGAWAGPSTFLYTTVDDAMRPHQVWRHQVGTPQDRDVLVLEEPDARFHVSVDHTTDHAYVVIDCRSAVTTEAWVVRSLAPEEAPRCIAPRRQGVEYGIDHLDGWFVAVTNHDAEDFRVVAAPDGLLPAPTWHEVLPHRPGTRVEEVLALSRWLVVAERANAELGLRILGVADHPPWPFGTDVLARSWTVDAGAHPATIHLGPNAEHDTDLLRLERTSLVTPRTVVDLSLADRRSTVRKRQPVGGSFDAADYVTWRTWAQAEDGTAVPVSLVRRADVALPGPCLLYGYGAYEHSIDPEFSPLRLSLLDRGVVFGIAHVRGGGELGRRWYEDGKLAAKPHTFSDFVACARHLVATGTAEPGRLAARGGSAGGLLMGAVANLAPTLFRAVVAEVPFVDALTTMLDPTLPLTVIEWEEWGNPAADQLIYDTMRQYSPYENVMEVDGAGKPVRYPDVLATAGLEDSRVGFWEPLKWVARLREANPANQALLRTELTAGHGGPSDRYAAWREEALVQAFLLDALGRCGEDDLLRRAAGAG